MVSFSRLRDGSWGLCSDAPLSEGDAVTVKKRDGSTSTAQVGRLVWQGHGAHIYASVALAPAPRIPGPGPGVRNAGQRKRPFRRCGYPGCSPEFCDECDGEGAGAW